MLPDLDAALSAQLAFGEREEALGRLARLRAKAEAPTARVWRAEAGSGLFGKVCRALHSDVVRCREFLVNPFDRRRAEGKKRNGCDSCW